MSMTAGQAERAELGADLRQRLDELGDSDPADLSLNHAARQLTAVYDVHLARLIRDGDGVGLREAGFTAVADELGL